MAVVDTDGVEVGYVSGEEPNVLVLGEGSSGRMRLGRRFVAQILDRVTLTGSAAQIFTGLNVVDSDGEFVGVVKDTMEAEDVLDSLIVEDEQAEMVTVLLEDVRSIDEWVELSEADEEADSGHVVGLDGLAALKVCEKPPTFHRRPGFPTHFEAEKRLRKNPFSLPIRRTFPRIVRSSRSRFAIALSYIAWTSGMTCR